MSHISYTGGTELLLQSKTDIANPIDAYAISDPHICTVLAQLLAKQLLAMESSFRKKGTFKSAIQSALWAGSLFAYEHASDDLFFTNTYLGVLPCI